MSPLDDVRTPRKDWQRIEQDALAQVRAELDVIESTPLVFADLIAWVDCRFGRTDGLGQVHRVGFPMFGRPYTTCGELIPAPIRWIPLSPRLAQSLGDCRYCLAECARIEREKVA